MLNFREWTQKIDQINSVYDKAHIAIEIAQAYSQEKQPGLLANVTTIANLASGAYGLYNSAENQKKLPPNIERWLIYKGIKKEDINKLPYVILKKWGVDPKQVQIGDTIHVNVRRILSQSKNDLDAVLQIASTTIHESVHEREREFTGTSSENGPKLAEQEFMQWARQNLDKIIQRYPELSNR